MSRNFLSALGIGMIATLIMVIILLGVGVALNLLLLGGIVDLYVGMTTLGDMTLIIYGITKVICSGPVALLAILAIQGLLKMVERLRAWRVGHG